VSRSALAAVLALALAPLVLEAAGLAIGGVRSALVLVLPLAVCGWPRRAPGFDGASLLALAPLGAAAGLDVAAGAAPRELALPAAVACACLLGLEAAASIASGAGRTRGVHALLWLVLVPGGSAFLVAVRLGSVSGREPGLLAPAAALAAFLERGSPPAWALGWAAGAPVDTRSSVAPLAVVGALVAVAWLGRALPDVRRSGERSGGARP